MRMSGEVLNDFLQAAGSRRMFSYGASKYYESLMFEKILLLEWPTQTIALSFERHLLEQIAMAYRAIQCFMLSAGEVSDRNLLHLQSPAFAHNLTNMLHGISLMITSPRKEAIHAHKKHTQIADHSTLDNIPTWVENLRASNLRFESLK
jgi:hypothetical protein